MVPSHTKRNRIIGGWGFAAAPIGGAYSAPQTSSGFQGREEREGKKGAGTSGKEEGAMRDGSGKKMRVEPLQYVGPVYAYVHKMF